MKKLFTLILLMFSLASFAQVNVSFKITAIDSNKIAVDTTKGVWVVGDFNKWKFSQLEDLGNHVYVFDTALVAGDTSSFYFLLVNEWDSAGNGDWSYAKRYREIFDSTSVANCTPSYKKWDGDRWFIVPAKDTVINVSWGKLCADNGTAVVSKPRSLNVSIYPNPTNGALNIEMPDGMSSSNFELIDITGKIIKSTNSVESKLSMDLSGTPKGIYMLRVSNGNNSIVKKVILQ